MIFDRKVKCPFCEKLVTIRPISLMEGSCALSLCVINSEPIPDYPENLIIGYCSECGNRLKVRLGDDFYGKE